MINNFNVEIDFVKYLQIIYKHKWVIILFLIIGLSLGFFYAARQPNIYKSSLTFFLPMSETGSSGFDSGYQQLLNMSAPANIDDYLFMLMDSNLMKSRVYEDMEIRFKNKKNLNRLIDLNKLRLQKKGALIFELSFQSEDKTVIIPVLKSALMNLEKLNYKFDIIAQKDFIIILDDAKKPGSPIGPDRNKIIFIFSAAGVSIGLILVFTLELLTHYFKGDKKS